MIRFLSRRVLGTIPLLLGIVTIIFFAIHTAPGDPALTMNPPGMSAEALEQFRLRHGLDEPIATRYVLWLRNVAQGDFGVSMSDGRPALDVALGFLPNTLLLSGTALGLAFLFGIVIGTVQAVRQYSRLDSSLSVVTLFFYSMPSFWLAIMMMLVFGYLANVVWRLPIYFPTSGAFSNDYEFMSAGQQILDRLWHLVLPAMTLVLVLMAGIARYMRASMLEVVRLDFVRTARAKGLPEHRVVFQHALRNALLPIVTLLGLYLPLLFSGTVFVEQVFSWPGTGRMIVEAIAQRDYPLIMVGTFFFAMMVVVGNILADLLYGWVDPRIRYE